VARYRSEGEAAVTPRSRRPNVSPARLPQSTIDLILELPQKLTKGLDNGLATIAWHLRHHQNLVVSAASIIRHLRAAGLVVPAPSLRANSPAARRKTGLRSTPLRRAPLATCANLIQHHPSS
jgi:hypothetical protein